MSVLMDIIQHLRKAIEAPPATTMMKYPSLASQGFKCADNGGARLDLEEMVGQSRVFEFNIEDSDTFPLYFGGAAPMAWREVMPIQVRYEANGPARDLDALDRIKTDQTAICHALMSSKWAEVPALATLDAIPGDIKFFRLADSATGQEFAGYISEVAVTISYDV